MTTWERVFDELVATRGHALTRYAYLLTGRQEDAADLVPAGTPSPSASPDDRGPFDPPYCGEAMAAPAVPVPDDFDLELTVDLPAEVTLDPAGDGTADLGTVTLTNHSTERYVQLAGGSPYLGLVKDGVVVGVAAVADDDKHDEVLEPGQSLSLPLRSDLLACDPLGTGVMPAIDAAPPEPGTYTAHLRMDAVGWVVVGTSTPTLPAGAQFDSGPEPIEIR